jgi:hypothetical protein
MPSFRKRNTSLGFDGLKILRSHEYEEWLSVMLSVLYMYVCMDGRTDGRTDRRPDLGLSSASIVGRILFVVGIQQFTLHRPMSGEYEHSSPPK